MEHFKNGEATELAYGQFFAYDFDDENSYLPGKEFIEEFNNTNIFKLKLVEIVKNPGKVPQPFTGTGDDELLEYLAKRCKRVIDKKTLNRWLVDGKVPNGEEKSRENVYKLCFALGFNEETTTEFFFKGYLERPFNFKRVNECVYYFCLKNQLSYEQAQSLIAEVEEKSSQNIQGEDLNTIATVYIENEIDTIHEKSDLVRYLVENNIAGMKQNVKGSNKVKELIENCLEELKKMGSKESVDQLLYVIYDFDARSTGFKEEKSITLKESRFPKYIKTNFPQRQQLENITKGKGSNDSIRKAIMMLYFFFYFIRDTKDTGDNKDADDFVDNLDLILEECGYELLYWRNPYDWMIVYCAWAANPLLEMQDLIAEFYLDVGYDE